MKKTMIKAEYIQPNIKFVLLPANDVLEDEGPAAVSLNTGTGGKVDEDDELAKPFDFSNEWSSDWSHSWDNGE